MQTRKLSPMPHEWMLISIIGFFVSLFLIHSISSTWGLLFDIVFIIMFISSVVGMGVDRIDEDHLLELSVHKKHVRAREHRKKKK